MYNLDTDECAETSSPCPEHTDCANTVGSFKCNCRPGFIQVNSSCEGTEMSLITLYPLRQTADFSKSPNIDTLPVYNIPFEIVAKLVTKQTAWTVKQSMIN